MKESERRGFSPTDAREGFLKLFFCFLNMGVVRVMKEMKLSYCKCHFEFFYHSGKWWRRTPTRPFWCPFSHPQWQLELTNGTRLYPPFAHLPWYTLFAPQTFCIRIVFNFSWGDYNTQEKLKTKVLQNFGGQTRSITRDVQMRNAVFEKRRLHLHFY